MCIFSHSLLLLISGAFQGFAQKMHLFWSVSLLLGREYLSSFYGGLPHSSVLISSCKNPSLFCLSGVSLLLFQLCHRFVADGHLCGNQVWSMLGKDYFCNLNILALKENDVLEKNLTTNIFTFAQFQLSSLCNYYPSKHTNWDLL